MSLYQRPLDPADAQSHVYDEIVVGAGPAGSAAAYHLAAGGADVLLVDRAAFPRDKRCGDAVMPPALEELALMGLADEVQKRFAATERIGIWIAGLPGQYSPLGEGARGYVAPRADFDALLCEQALRHGASWLDRVTVQEVRARHEAHALVCGVRGQQPVELRARLVIAADGSGSRQARQLREELAGLPDPAGDPLTPPQDDRARFTAMRGYFSGIESLGDALEFYFRGEVGTFYYWIFPVGRGVANVGVIANMKQLRAWKTHLAGALADFLQAPELVGRAARAQLEGHLGAAPIAAGLRGTALFGERWLCTGDAAALVDPSSAEGISGALWSGRVAAETAIAALGLNNYSLAVLSSYGAAVRARYQARYDAQLSHP